MEGKIVQSRDMNDQADPGQKPAITRRKAVDYSSIILLTVLYCYQGIILGFFLDYTKTWLIEEKHIRGEDIAVLRSIAWPFSIKFLFAPIIDTYYSDSFGKRQTYIVPAQIFLSAVFISCSFFYEDWMNEVDLTSIVCAGMTCMILIVIQDIAVDGWSIEILPENNRAYASFSQSFGHRIGKLVGYQLFTYLNDEEIVRRFLGDSFPILTPRIMCCGMAGSILLGTLIVVLKRRKLACQDIATGDKSDLAVIHAVASIDDTAIDPAGVTTFGKVYRQETGIRRMFAMIRLFFSNKNVVSLILFHLSCFFGLYCIEVPAPILLQNKGFSRQTLATIDFCLLPFIVIIGCITTRVAAKKRQEWTLWKGCFVLRSAWNLMIFYVVDSYEQTPGEQPSGESIAIVVILLAWKQMLELISQLATGAFLLRVCDEEFGGLYITFINSFQNTGRAYSIVALSAVSMNIDFKILAVVGTIYNVAVYAVWGFRRVDEMQQKSTQEWKLVPEKK